MNIKDKISMAEFGAIVNTVVEKCFETGSYDPTYEHFWLTYSIVSVFCDFPFENKDIEEIWDELQDRNSEVSQTWEQIRTEHEQAVTEIEYAVTKSIAHKNHVGAYSMTDMALTNLIDAVSEKIDGMEDVFTADNVQALVNMSGKLSKLNNVSQKKIVQTIIESFQKRGIKKEGE